MEEPEAFRMLESLYYRLNPDLNDDVRTDIFSRHTLKSYEKGAMLLQEGDVCGFVGLVVKGLLRMYHAPADKEVVFDFYEEGRLVSDYTSFVTREKAVCCIEALEETRVLMISYDDVELLYARHLEMYKTVTAALDALYVVNAEKYSAIMLDDLEKRYLDFLKHRPGLVPRIPQYQIASYLGVTPEALTRMRRSIGL